MTFFLSPLFFLLPPFSFMPKMSHHQTDRQPSGWLQLTLHLEMRTKVCNEAPKINRMWLIAATVTLNAQTVRTSAGKEMRGGFSEESQSYDVKEQSYWNQQGFSDQLPNSSYFVSLVFIFDQRFRNIKNGTIIIHSTRWWFLCLVNKAG